MNDPYEHLSTVITAGLCLHAAWVTWYFASCGLLADPSAKSRHPRLKVTDTRDNVVYVTRR